MEREEGSPGIEKERKTLYDLLNGRGMFCLCYSRECGCRSGLGLLAVSSVWRGRAGRIREKDRAEIHRKWNRHDTVIPTCCRAFP